MAAGDAQRVWFPEMIERLRAKWDEGMYCDAVVESRDELDGKLQRIRSERNIHSAILKCPRSGRVAGGADPQVSVRAMILSPGRSGIACAAQTRAMEKCRAAHRKQHWLDLSSIGLISMASASLLRAAGVPAASTLTFKIRFPYKGPATLTATAWP